MKSIKMLGLAAFVALMAMALLGASSAMALSNTQLCKADESVCAAGNVISHVHEETLTGAKATLLSSAGNIECKALFLGDTLGLNKPLVIHGHYTYSECKRGSENCTVTEVGSDTLKTLLKVTFEDIVKWLSWLSSFRCGFFINCTYDGEELSGTGREPLSSSFENGDETLSEQTLHHVSGALCPATAKLDISTMPLEKVYFSE